MVYVQREYKYGTDKYLLKNYENLKKNWSKTKL